MTQLALCAPPCHEGGQLRVVQPVDPEPGPLTPPLADLLHPHTQRPPGASLCTQKPLSHSLWWLREKPAQVELTLDKDMPSS